MRGYVAAGGLLASLGLLGPPAARAQVDRCLKGFFDLRNGGECRECPSGYGRTAAPVTSEQACEKAVQSMATFLGDDLTRVPDACVR